MYTKDVTYQLRIFSFYNYSRTPLVCFICIKQTVTVAVLYFSSTILGVEYQRLRRVELGLVCVG